MKVIVCGGRDLVNVAFIWSRLDRLHAQYRFTALLHGGQRGVDTIAGDWAKTKTGIKRYKCKAKWGIYGRAAGPMRNARMLEWEPDLVIAFPGNTGTANMVEQAHKAGVPVVFVED